MSRTEQYKLTYFNGRGRAEVTRLIFAEANVNYEDVRVEKEQWPALKPKMPHGQLPVLEVNGKLLAQSHAIERYLATKFGLMGANDWEAAKIDELVMDVEDLFQKMIPWIHENDATKKVELWENFSSGPLKSFSQEYEKLLINNGTGYFVGKKISLADLTIFNMLHTVESITHDYFKKYPKLKEFMVKIEELPNIKAWIQKRPKTEF